MKEELRTVALFIDWYSSRDIIIVELWTVHKSRSAPTIQDQYLITAVSNPSNKRVVTLMQLNFWNQVLASVLNRI